MIRLDEGYASHLFENIAQHSMSMFSEAEAASVQNLKGQYGFNDYQSACFEKFYAVIKFDICVTSAQHGTLIDEIDFENEEVVEYFALSAISEMYEHEILGEEFFDLARKIMSEALDTTFSLGSYPKNKTEIRRVTEGVTKERSDPMSKEDTEEPILSDTFSGAISREDMSRAMKYVIREKGLSVRKAAAATSANASDISRIKDGTATIDKAVEVLGELGYELEFQLVPKGQ